MSEKERPIGCQIDHIVSLKHGGENSEENLAVGVSTCNLNKGTDLGSINRKTGELVRLFNPRRDQWSEHFCLKDGRIKPLTDIGNYAKNMAYSDFKLEELKTKFNLSLVEQVGLIESNDITPSDWLTETLRRNLRLATAINTEKARSELLIAPILVELKEFNPNLSLFSGTDFNVDAEQGLNGVCDFLVSQSSEQLAIEAPVLLLVEAKKENLNLATPQCIAEMFAAQIFNQNRGNQIESIYGVVTTGSVWRFLKLKDNIVTIDLNEIYLNPVDILLGILTATLGNKDGNHQ
jgi:hypothetical protein